MSHHYPPIQVVDEDDKPVRGASMEEVHGNRLIHRIVMTFVLSLEGDLLLQKRGPLVSTNRNKWDVSSAGHVDEGEDYETAARRELKEELGIAADGLEEIGYFRATTHTDGLELDRFRKIYKTTVPRDIKIVIAEDEISEARWFTKSELAAFVKEYPDELVPDFVDMLNKYYL